MPGRLYLKARRKARLFEQLKARFVARKALRKYSSKICCLNSIGVSRSIILRRFPVFVPFCNSVSTSVPGELQASNPLNFLDFWHAEDLL